MKSIVSTIIVCMIAFSSFGQQSLTLKILEGADDINTDLDQFYSLEVNNTTNSSKTFFIEAVNGTCVDISQDNQVNLYRDVLDDTKQNDLGTVTLASGQSLKFYVKIFRTENTSLNKWNCIEIRATSNQGASVRSNSIVIKTFIPNPLNNN